MCNRENREKSYYEHAKELQTDYSESSLSRLVDYMNQYDCGTITAYRAEYTHKENQQRNKSLKAKLASLTYGITSVKGSFIENFGSDNSREVGEHVFFVVDIRKKGNLEKTLRILGEQFDQDSILYIPKGGEKSFLIGTKHSAYPGYGVRKELPVRALGKGNYEFLTKVDGDLSISKKR